MLEGSKTLCYTSKSVTAQSCIDNIDEHQGRVTYWPKFWKKNIDLWKIFLQLISVVWALFSDGQRLLNFKNCSIGSTKKLLQIYVSLHLSMDLLIISFPFIIVYLLHFSVIYNHVYIFYTFSIILITEMHFDMYYVILFCKTTIH